MPRPTHTPIGLALSRSSRAVERAFDVALAERGGSRPVWLVLLALTTAPPRTQQALADAVGIRGATLSHHLAGMEAGGLVERVRNPDNRREHVVTLTDAGRAAFQDLAQAARAHDARLRRGLTADEVETLRRLLDALRHNVEEV